MFKSYYENLKPGQIIIIAILLIIVIFQVGEGIFNKILGVGKNIADKTYVPYEPWDPDNINVIREKIVKLNKEGSLLNTESEFVQPYRDNLSTSVALLNSILVDSSNSIPLFIQIQPFLVFQGEKLRYTDVEPSLSEANFKSKSFQNVSLDIARNKVYLYNAIYTDLLKRCGIVPTYYRQYVLHPEYLSYNQIIESDFQRDSFAMKAIRETELKNGIGQLRAVIVSLDSSLSKRQTVIKERNEVLQKDLEKQIALFKGNRFDINQYAVIIGIPLFIASALLMYYYGLRNGNKLKDSVSQTNNDFRSADYKTGLSFTLYTITVLLLILSLLILGLAKVIAENALAALLGTIAGYILNNATDKTSTPAPTKGNP